VQHAELDGEVAAAGRVMLRRVMGKLAFITLRDGSGNVQLYLEKQAMTDNDPESFRCAESCWLNPSRYGIMQMEHSLQQE